MKQINRLVGIAMVVALPSLSQAQDSPRHPLSFGVSGGASVPMGDDAQVGYNLGGHVLVMPASLPLLSFRGDVSLDTWKFKSGSAQSAREKTSMLGVAANIIIKSTSAKAVKPYGIGGLGFYNSKTTGLNGNANFADGVSTSNLGVQAGAGLDFQLSGVTTFLEAKLVNSFTRPESSTWLRAIFGIRF
ncbi:MAG: outer membrane beta-barrel protein [Gemmatimonas sp.]